MGNRFVFYVLIYRVGPRQSPLLQIHEMLHSLRVPPHHDPPRVLAVPVLVEARLPVGPCARSAHQRGMQPDLPRSLSDIRNVLFGGTEDAGERDAGAKCVFEERVIFIVRGVFVIVSRLYTRAVVLQDGRHHRSARIGWWGRRVTRGNIYPVRIDVMMWCVFVNVGWRWWNVEVDNNG